MQNNSVCSCQVENNITDIAALCSYIFEVFKWIFGFGIFAFVITCLMPVEMCIFRTEFSRMEFIMDQSNKMFVLFLFFSMSIWILARICAQKNRQKLSVFSCCGYCHSVEVREPPSLKIDSKCKQWCLSVRFFLLYFVSNLMNYL